MITQCPSFERRDYPHFLTIVGIGPEKAALLAQEARLTLDDWVRFVGAMRQVDLPAHVAARQ